MKEGLSFDDVLIIPKYSKIESRHDVSLETRLGKYSFKIPIIAANMDRICESEMAIAMNELGGLGVIHRFNSIDYQYEEAEKVRKNNEKNIVAVALGVKDLKERSKKLDSVADIFVLDIAHGHSKHAIDAVKYLKDNYEKYLIAGNVATMDGAMDLYQAGADCIKVGIGPGKVCRTRDVTGCGVPQFTAVLDIAKNKKYDIIADGGIRTSGDIVKSLGVGTNAVMLGYLLSGTDETPGEIFFGKHGLKYKIYRGMSSREVNGRLDVASEGVSIDVLYKGSVKQIISDLVMGVKSGLSYVGARNLDELVKKIEFIKIRK